jgi:hypothetical protein
VRHGLNKIIVFESEAEAFKEVVTALKKGGKK